MSQRLQKIEVGNHIVAIYNNREEKFNDIFEFLNTGILRNEVAMLITEELTKKEIIDRMKSDLKERVNIEELIDKGDIIIKSTSEWYFPGGVPSVQRTKALWTELLNRLSKRGKNGLRVVGDMSTFFKYGLQKQLLEYETSLEQNFDFPLTAICAYNKEDLNRYFTLEELKDIQAHHNPVWE
jgi:MEDS: MEthanogen/methylotroph, DcmR Sensory domain